MRYARFRQQAVSVKIISCDIYADMRSADGTAVAPAGHGGCHIAKRGGSCGSQQHCQPGTGPLARLAIGFASAALFWRTQAMARFVVSPVLVAMLALIAPWGAAWAQERATCSQARAHCGTQRVCQKRFDNCMQTG